MERIITVLKGKGAPKVSFKSAATTLSELKADMRANGIEYDSNTAFYEGISNTSFDSDSAILPHDIPYKGRVTNDLVIMLTVRDKNIKSGASRVELYAKVKEILAKDPLLKEEIGNYTQASSDSLSNFIERHSKASSLKGKVVKKVEAVSCDKPVKSEEPTNSFSKISSRMDRLEKMVNETLDLLIDNDLVSEDDVEDIRSSSDEEPQADEEEKKEVEKVVKEKGPKCPYDDDELDSMFKRG